MIVFGTQLINKFEIIISSTDPHNKISDLNPDFFDILIHERINNFLCYVNLNKDSRFPFYILKHPPKLIKVRKKNDSDDEEEVKDTPEEAVYREHWRWYESRKDIGMPMWRIHKDILNQVLETCQKLK